jgi:alkylation response protein AidB-like acyl-CoA dehydrogenase
MSTIESATATQVLDAARALAPLIRANADEAERERRLPEALLQELKDAGLFRMWLPKVIGGDELDPLSTMRVIEEVARADGSTGWCVMVAAQCAWGLPSLDQDTVAGVFNRDDIFASSISPGTAVAVDGGYRATGRWTFASGCRHATWIWGTCRIVEGEQVRQLPDGTPETRNLFFRAADCQILDTWHTTGLRGTGSHDFAVTDVFVPSALATPGRFSDPLTMRQRWGGPLYRAFFVWPMRGAQALGIARHAIDELIELAATKKPFGANEVLRNLPRAQDAVARAEAALASVRAYLYETVAGIWDAVLDGREQTAEQRVRMPLATAYTAETCAQVVESMYRLAGGTAIYTSSPLERCFRDVNTLMADQAVAPRLFEAAGVEPPSSAT